MKKLFVLLLCVAFVATASVRTGTPGHNDPALNEGSYTIVTQYPVGLSGSYGLTICEPMEQIFISNYGDLLNYGYDLHTGDLIGTWETTGGIDPDDQAFCEYTSNDQWFFGHWGAGSIAYFDQGETDPYFIDWLAGPDGWAAVCGVAAGHDNLYASSFFVHQIAWGTYTGTGSPVTWTTAEFSTVSGMAVWEDYLFVCTQITGEDNIFIFGLDETGAPNMTPIWSCEFVETTDGPNGSLDYDGEYLWVYPQNEDLFVLDIDWTPQSLEATTWGDIKSTF